MMYNYAGLKNPAGPQPKETTDRELPKRTFCSWSTEIFSVQFWPRSREKDLSTSFTAELGEDGEADQAGIPGRKGQKREIRG